MNSKAQSSNRTEAAVVETTYGKVRGTFRDGIHGFRGIPYGESTAGARRWLPPAPPQPWTGVRETVEYGPRAPQNERPSREPHLTWIRDRRPWNEDCLALNVWTPAANDPGRRPVLVYIHGGGYVTGSSSAPGIEGTHLARRGDVVVVSMNHRLNVFGHLHLAAVDGSYADAGNAGMLDLVAALRWVRDNIASFGGDSGNVTIFGQSGGASKVAVLMAMPSAQGLFHQAIAQSASSLLRVAEPDAAARMAELLMAEAGARTVRELQEVPADRLLQCMAGAVKAGGGIDNFRPVADGRSLPFHPWSPAALALSANVPLLIGNCEDEAAFAFSQQSGAFFLTADQVHAQVQRFVGIGDQEAARLIETYRATRPGASPGKIFVAIHSDHMYRRSVTTAAELKAAQAAAPVWMYHMTWKTPVLKGVLGTPHTICLPFVFGNVDIASGITGTDAGRYRLMERMMDAWIAFASSGNPNHRGLPEWQPYSAADRATMIFDNECALAFDPRREDRLAFEGFPAYVPEAVGRR
jgi:para-nitrobenzyl esterase